jgi:hypothetical protein
MKSSVLSSIGSTGARVPVPIAVTKPQEYL